MSGNNSTKGLLHLKGYSPGEGETVGRGDLFNVGMKGGGVSNTMLLGNGFNK